VYSWGDILSKWRQPAELSCSRNAGEIPEVKNTPLEEHLPVSNLGVVLEEKGAHTPCKSPQ